MRINTSPESFMIRDNNYSIISCSPETLINKKNDIIITKPIAGTLKRNKNTSFDKAKKFFSKSKKESKEHNMIVDMERNDLSRICKVGSVRIKKLKYVGLHSDVSVYKTKFSITKNIRFSNTNRIANKFARVFKRLKPFKF